MFGSVMNRGLAPTEILVGERDSSCQVRHRRHVGGSPIAVTIVVCRVLRDGVLRHVDLVLQAVDFVRAIG